MQVSGEKYFCHLYWRSLLCEHFSNLNWTWKRSLTSLHILMSLSKKSTLHFWSSQKKCHDKSSERREFKFSLELGEVRKEKYELHKKIILWCVWGFISCMRWYWMYYAPHQISLTLPATWTDTLTFLQTLLIQEKENQKFAFHRAKELKSLVFGMWTCDMMYISTCLCSCPFFNCRLDYLPRFVKSRFVSG